MYEVALTGDGNLPALREDLLPVIFEPKEVKRPWYKKRPKIEVVQLDAYFEYVENKITVYKVIPHANVSGNNKRMWATIHKMYEMYGGVKSRLDRKGKKIHFREKDYLWFDIIFRQVNGKKKVEFYISTSEFQSSKLKRKIENVMNVTLQEAEIGDLTIPEEDTVVQELRYLRHDIFSLNTNVNANERQTPIASILNTVDDLQYDGDVARLSICNEVENRRKWVKNASWAKEKLTSGKVPQRVNGSVKSVVPYVKTGMAGVMNEVYYFLQETMAAISHTFFKDNGDGVRKQKLVDGGHKLEDEINSTKLSYASGEKVNKPVFRSHIRVASHSQDRLTRDTLGETLAISLNDMAEDNEIHGVRIRRPQQVIEEMNGLRISKKTKYAVDANLVSTDEMSKLALQMPTRELQMKYADEMSARKNVETVIPNVLRDSGNLMLGHSQLKDEEIPVGLNTQAKDEFYCGYTFIGKQGGGKDTAIQNFVYEGATKHNISFVVMDWICEPGHRGMADGVRDLLPPHMVVDIDLANEDWVVPMDLTEVIDALGRKGGSRFAMEMVDFMDLGDLPRSQKYLMEASKASKGSLRNIKRIIEDEDFRAQTIERLMAEGNMRTATDLANWGTNDDLGNKCDAIMNRMNMFFGDDTLYDIFSQPPKEEVNFEKWMKEGKTIIVRMPKRILGGGSNILAHWVTLKVLMTRMLMNEEDKEKHGCFVVFNEPEQVGSKGMSELMGRIATEGRKERLGSIFAFHHWDKLPVYLQHNLMAGGVNQLLFASEYKKTYENAKERLLPNFTIEQALHTPKYHAIALLNTREPIPAFLVKMAPPVPKDRRFDNSRLTKEHAKLYGRSWEELQRLSV